MKYTIRDFHAEYPNEERCLERLMEVQYGGTEITCPACGVEHAKFHLMRKRKAYACQECGHHIYSCAETIFHKSRTPLTKWFLAMYLMTSTRSGVAAKELERALGVTYKTAWRMAHELRKLMAAADYPGQLSGHVEADETFIGGKQTRREYYRKGGKSNKTVLFGVVERDGGKLRAGPIPDVTNYTIEPIIAGNVQAGSIVSTDEAPVYNHLLMRGYDHGRVNHSVKEYVKGIHHTNTIEGHWSHFKRSVAGTHIHISAKHMWKYVSEFSYRYNYRYSHTVMFNRLIGAFALPRLEET